MSLTIGKLACAASVNIETVRYYQRIGLLQEPDKPQIGYRQYPVTDVARLRFVKRAQYLGFTLKEIVELLSLGEDRCESVKVLAEQKRDRIKIQIRGLESIHAVLLRLIEGCATDQAQHCSMIDALSHEDNQSP
ncbi:MAG: MerR family transcriptional regulator [Methylococcales bacterium]|nr:MerR family transcriptional regulator [Methylococcales bacterium]MEE2767246.1 MerR family transcriptional regulator [Pseudomonadota bacterium]